MVMPKELQKKTLEKILREKGIDPQTVDLDALIDPQLSFPENVRKILSELGLQQQEGDYREDDIKRMEEALNNQALENHLREQGLEEEFDQRLQEEEERHYEQMRLEFERIIKEHDPLEYFSRYIAPEVVGEQYEPIKKAILLSLATHYDKAKRTRIHVLLVGPPGTAKTEILKFLHLKLWAALVNGEYASKVGLTGDARGKEVTPGLLAQYDGNVVCIDEVDKLSVKDQGGLLQAMEEGYYTIVKAKHRAKFRAEVRVIASANDINKITKPLLDRFDFVFELKNPAREERKKNIGALVDQFFGAYQAPSIQILYDYLQWISNFEPRVEEIDKIKEVMRAYIELTNQNLEEKSYRSLELSILRVAYAIAKLSRQNVNAEHVVKAIKLKDQTLTREQYRYLIAIAKGLIQ